MADHLRPGAVRRARGTSLAASGLIGTNQIKNNAVTTSKLADGAVMTNELARHGTRHVTTAWTTGQDIGTTSCIFIGQALSTN